MQIMYAIRRMIAKRKNRGMVKFEGKNQKIYSNVTISARNNGCITLLGEVLLNSNSTIICNGGTIQIEDNVSINRNSIIVSREKIVIGKGTSIGPNVCIYDHDHLFDLNGISKREFKTVPIIIGKHCWIAAGVTILRGTYIGDGCVIGAGVIVSGNVPEHSIVKGDRGMIINEIHNQICERTG